jgi:uncharacterized protein YkwD
MKRIPVVVFSAVVVLTLGLLVWQRAHIARFISIPSKSLMGKAGADMSAAKAEFLSATEREIVSELNLARTNPQQYATFLEEAKKSLAGNQIKLGGAQAIMIKEGVKAVDEAIAFLRASKPLPALQLSKGLSLGAKDHVKDMSQSGSFGHKGTDGSLPEQRVSRYGNWQQAVAENIAYSSSSAREAILGMIIDDGVPGRGHRLNIFNTNHRIAGVAGQPSPRGILCVVTYAGSYMENAGTGGSSSSTASKMF